MDKTEAKERLAELAGQIYWHERGTFRKENIAELRAEHEEIKQGLKADAYPLETNENGCTVQRMRHEGTRYDFDFGPCRVGTGWQQYDTNQDASYFGVWVHLEKREIVTFAEGDVTIVTAPDDDALRAELDEMADFYGDPPPAFTAISLPDESGQVRVTEYYDERPTL